MNREMLEIQMIAELQQKLVDLEKSRNTLENENKEV